MTHAAWPMERSEQLPSIGGQPSTIDWGVHCWIMCQHWTCLRGTRKNSSSQHLVFPNNCYLFNGPFQPFQNKLGLDIASHLLIIYLQTEKMGDQYTLSKMLSESFMQGISGFAIKHWFRDVPLRLKSMLHSTRKRTPAKMPTHRRSGLNWVWFSWIWKRRRKADSWNITNLRTCGVLGGLDHIIKSVCWP